VALAPSAPPAYALELVWYKFFFCEFRRKLYTQCSHGWLGSSMVTQGVGLATRWSRVRFPAAAACTGMVDRLLTGKPPRYFIKPSGPTQSPTLRGTGNEYRPNCGDAVVDVSNSGEALRCGEGHFPFVRLRSLGEGLKLPQLGPCTSGRKSINQSIGKFLKWRKWDSHCKDQ